MRIMLDTQSTLGHRTGIGHYTDKLLAALRRVAPQHEYLEASWGAGIVMRTDRRLRWQQCELPRCARAQRADLLHVTGFDAPLVRPCPVVLTVHDLIGMLFPHNLPPVARLYWGRWLPMTIRRANHIIADSDHTRNDLIRLLGLPAERISVVHLGVDRTFRPLQRPALAALRHKYDLAEPCLLYVGTLDPRKGLDTLITAFGLLAARIPHHLVIAGQKGWYVDALFRQVEALGVGRRVHFTGYVADDDLPTLYNLADLFVFPSRYEGFGLPVLEAMACGTPVVCSNASSLPEVAGEAALLVPSDDAPALAAAVESVLGQPTLADQMRAQGLARAKRFSWEETARRTARVYEGLR